MMRIMLRAPSIVTRQSLGEHLVQKHWNPVKAVLGMEKSKGLRLSTYPLAILGSPTWARTSEKVVRIGAEHL